jgi:hypothetical protein
LQTAKKDCNRSLLKTEKYTVKDGFLRGIVESDQVIDITYNYYQCFDVERGDVVLFIYSDSHDPALKVVRAISGDHVELIKDTVHQGWNVKVNDQLVPFYEDTPYYLGTDKRDPVLQSHLALEKDSRLGQDKVLALSTVPRGRSDSGTFGLIPTHYLIGKASGLKNLQAAK